MGRAMTGWLLVADLHGPGGIRLVGFSGDVAKKLGYTVVLVAALAAARWLARVVLVRALRGRHWHTVRFWTRQIVNLLVAVLFIAITLSIWFDQPSRLVTGLGLFSAGLAFALQQVITSIAGYLLLLRGNVFAVGDRIDMGGVRGDVIALGFLRTTILEMGSPPGDDLDSADTATSWVAARQYTGRIVTVANSAIFDQPVFNYSRDFPYLWEELRVPVPYAADRARAEHILLDVARRHSVDIDRVRSQALDSMRRRYLMPATDLEPAVFYRLTDNWLELTVRFAVPSHGIRTIKSDMSRAILEAFEQAGIEIASATYDIVGFPPVRIQHEAAPYPDDATRADDAAWRRGAG